MITWGVPHIDLPPLPGIAGLLAGHPETAGPLNSLAQALLRGPSPLTPAQRETIAAYVSRRNECTFCANSHAETERELGASQATPKMQALLAIAAKLGGKRLPRLAVPNGVLRLAAPIGRFIGQPNLRELVAASAGVTYWASAEKAQRDLGVTARSLEDGLRDMFEIEADRAYTRS